MLCFPLLLSLTVLLISQIQTSGPSNFKATAYGKKIKTKITSIFHYIPV